MNTFVRMYRGFLGDCFLLGFDRQGGGKYYVMIDCGAVLGQSDATAKMRAIAAHIKSTTEHIDLLIATHEHWDHVSGFIQAGDIFKGITFDEVWLAWTENLNDPQASKLKADHEAALDALCFAEQGFNFYTDSVPPEQSSAFTSLFSAAAVQSTRQAFDVIRGCSPNVKYRDPKDEPKELPGTGVLTYVLGPPRDERLLRTLSQSPSSPEMYGMDTASIRPDPTFSPFDAMQSIPMNVARELPFFRQRYWGNSVAPATDAPAWRRIDDETLQDATELALQLDSYTNNTSLVVAFELPDQRVLLFPGDAQIGSWLSWKNLEWRTGNRLVTGPDLLKRTAFYKVGHHGSHNATARASGLEEMAQLKMAMIPVDHDEALKKHWDRMPLPNLVDALNEQTKKQVLRADDEALPPGITAIDDKLYYEVSFQSETSANAAPAGKGPSHARN